MFGSRTEMVHQPDSARFLAAQIERAVQMQNPGWFHVILVPGCLKLISRCGGAIG
jgi:hypothetical protein